MHLFKLLVWLGILPQPIVKVGSGRIVWIFPRFAVKFPRTQIKKLSRIIWKFRKNKQMLKIIFKSKSPSFPWTLNYFLTKGFLDNWGEFVFYMKNKDCPFLFPTYFSFFGIFNITPIGTELKKYPLFFLGNTFRNEDKHHFTNSANFCIYQERTCIWDYGNSLTQSVILGNIDIMNKFSLEADLK